MPIQIRCTPQIFCMICTGINHEHPLIPAWNIQIVACRKIFMWISRHSCFDFPEAGLPDCATPKSDRNLSKGGSDYNILNCLCKAQVWWELVIGSWPTWCIRSHCHSLLVLHSDGTANRVGPVLSVIFFTVGAMICILILMSPFTGTFPFPDTDIQGLHVLP